jgi:hypothetical protein
MAIKHLFADSIRKACCLTGLMLVLATGAAVAEGGQEGSAQGVTTVEQDDSAQALTQEEREKLKELIDRLCMYWDGGKGYTAQWWGADRNGSYSAGNGAISFSSRGTYTEIVGGTTIKGEFTVTDTEITFERPNDFPVTKRYTLEDTPVGTILTLIEENGTVTKFKKSHW